MERHKNVVDSNLFVTMYSSKAVLLLLLALSVSGASGFWCGNDLSDIFDSLKKVAEDKFEDVKNTVEDAYNEASERLEERGAEIVEIFTPVKNMTRDLVENAKKTTEDVYEDAVGLVKVAGADLVDVFTPAVESLPKQVQKKSVPVVTEATQATPQVQVTPQALVKTEESEWEKFKRMVPHAFFVIFLFIFGIGIGMLLIALLDKCEQYCEKKINDYEQMQETV
uniref:Zgc: n=1 Tax=Steinernema glaseri TaxID=37863 RepID=A0A1I8AHL7_9BILA